MVDGTSGERSPFDAVPGVRLDVANPARIYDYDLGGHHNFAVDRQAAEEIRNSVAPTGPFIARANRAFLQRAVRYCLDEGIEQFLDLGSGIPTVGNVHEIAQQHAPSARVVYVDEEPVAVAQTRHLLRGDDRAAIVRADVRRPSDVLRDPETARLLDFSRPVGLLLVAVLHYVERAHEQQVLRPFLDALAPGSRVVISALTADGRAAEAERVREFFAANTTSPVTFRARSEFAGLFDGLRLVEPGVVRTPLWRPDPADPAGWDPVRSGCWAGVAARD